MAPFIVSSFGLFVMGLFAGLFTTPSWQTFILLAYGWAVAGGERQTITTYLWLSGATTIKHWSCFYPFLGGALYLRPGQTLRQDLLRPLQPPPHHRRPVGPVGGADCD